MDVSSECKMGHCVKVTEERPISERISLELQSPTLNALAAQAETLSAADNFILELSPT